MESNRVEALLQKYFDGETSIDEEIELKEYFSSNQVASHLTEHKPLFQHLANAKKQQSTNTEYKFKMNKDQKIIKKRNFYWLSIAASMLVLLGVGSYMFYASDNRIENDELGTYDDPKVAFEETQKALSLLSLKVNVGIESVQYIEEYQNTKNRIFRSPKNNSQGL